ncbi:hypothetical protein Q9L58_010523 [Maublancomyces gigas]|uniref:Uncharacterized protein n=1 Tax=Discina gigas TaxID=1032678 RepID=A0ABR3G3X1_9PEZI
MSSFGKRKGPGGTHHGSNLRPIARADAHTKVEIEPAFPLPLCLLDEESDEYGLYHCIRVHRVAPAPAPAPAPGPALAEVEADVLQSPVAACKNEDDDASACTCTCNIQAGTGQPLTHGNSLCIKGDPSLTEYVLQSPVAKNEDDEASTCTCTCSLTENEQSSVKAEIDDDPAYHSTSTQENGDIQGNVQTNALAISSTQTLLDLAAGDLLASAVESTEDDDANSGQDLDQDLNLNIGEGEFSMGGEDNARDLPADTLAFAMDHDDHDIDQDLNQVVDEDVLPSYSVSGRGIQYVAADSAPGGVWRDSTPDHGQEYEEEEEEEEEEIEKEVSPPSSPDELWNDAEYSISSGGSNCSADSDYQMREISSPYEPDEDNEEPVLPTNPESHGIDRLVLPPLFGLEHYRDILALTVADAQDPFPSRPSLKETVDRYKNHKPQVLGTGLGPDMDGPQPSSEGRSAAINPRGSPSSSALPAEVSDGTPTTEASSILPRRRSRRYLKIPSHDRTTRSMVNGQALYKQLPGYGTSIKKFLSKKIEKVRGRGRLSRSPLTEGSSLGEGSTSPPRATRTRKSSVSAENESPRRRRKTISRSKRGRTTEPEGNGPALTPVVMPLVNKFLHLGGSRNPRSNGGPIAGLIGAGTVPRIPSPLGNPATTHPLGGYSYFGHLRSPEPVMSGLEMADPESSRSVKRVCRAASAPVTSNTFNFMDLTISEDPPSTRTPLLPSRLSGNAFCRVHGRPITRSIHPLRTHGSRTETQHGILRYPASTMHMASLQNRSDSASTAPGETAAFIPASFGEIVTTTGHDWTIANANRWIALANATAGEGSNLVALGLVSEIASASTPSNSAPSSQHPGSITSETRSQDEGRYIQMPDGGWVNAADMAAAARYTCGSDGKWSKIE